MAEISKKESEAHLKRKAWNETTIARLGLICKKQSDQTKSITVYQGEICLFHEWTANPEKWTIINLHCKLEKFLLQYIEHIKSFKYQDK